jgi:hypothetical protein
MHSNKDGFSEPPTKDGFSKEESITANLRLRSVSPMSRTLLGFFAFIPSLWRGPVAIVIIIILGFLALKIPALIDWVKGAH